MVAPIDYDDFSVAVSQGFCCKLAHRNRERISERTVHSNGWALSVR